MLKLDSYLGRLEAAQYLGINISTLKSWIHTGKIVGVIHPITKRMVYTHDYLDAILGGFSKPHNVRKPHNVSKPHSGIIPLAKEIEILDEMIDDLVARIKFLLPIMHEASLSNDSRRMSDTVTDVYNYTQVLKVSYDYLSVKKPELYKVMINLESLVESFVENQSGKTLSELHDLQKKSQESAVKKLMDIIEKENNKKQ